MILRVRVVKIVPVESVFEHLLEIFLVERGAPRIYESLKVWTSHNDFQDATGQGVLRHNVFPSGQLHMFHGPEETFVETRLEKESFDTSLFNRETFNIGWSIGFIKDAAHQNSVELNRVDIGVEPNQSTH